LGEEEDDDAGANENSHGSSTSKKSRGSNGPDSKVISQILVKALQKSNLL